MSSKKIFFFPEIYCELIRDGHVQKKYLKRIVVSLFNNVHDYVFNFVFLNLIKTYDFELFNSVLMH